MHDPGDIVSFMIWLHETGSFGDIYRLSPDRFLWKRAGTDYVYLCEKTSIKLINVSKA